MTTTKKINERQNFIEWLATPSELRQPATQKELAKKLKVDAATLSDWKNENELWTDVREQLKTWGRGKTPDVLQALLRNIFQTGSPTAVKLWLEIFEPRINEEATNSVPVALVKFLGCDCSDGAEETEYKTIPSMTDEELRKLNERMDNQSD